VSEPTPEELAAAEKARKAEAMKFRKSMLIRARNRAYVILAGENPTRFQQIKDDLLVKWGFDPISQSHQRRHGAINPADPPGAHPADSDRSQ
jgi:hypothetical protein